MEKVKILLGKRIKELREGRKLTQEKLSEKIDVNNKAVSKIECGNVFPSKVLDKLADAFEMTLSELFDYEHIEYSTEEKKEFIDSVLKDIDDEKLTYLFKFVKLII